MASISRRPGSPPISRMITPCIIHHLQPVQSKERLGLAQPVRGQQQIGEVVENNRDLRVLAAVVLLGDRQRLPIALPFFAFLEFRQARKAVLGEHQIDAFHDDIVRLAILGVGDLPDFSIGRLWHVNTCVLHVRPRLGPRGWFRRRRGWSRRVQTRAGFPKVRTRTPLFGVRRRDLS
jgi:hypothetical protein